MGIQAAIDTRALSQRITSAMKPINENFFQERALLKLAENRIKWNCSHTEFEWFVRNVPTGQTATFGNPDGELSILTFEEQKPVNRAHLPFCYIKKTYGVGDRTIEANRNATDNKIFGAVKENMQLAYIFMYDALGPSIYNKNLTSEDPVGLLAMVGNPINTGNHAVIPALASYAGRTLSTAGFTGSTTKGLVPSTASAWDDAQFSPTVGSVEDVLLAAGSSETKWSTGCLYILDYMAEQMSRTASTSGTGKRIKPDIALMNMGPYMAVKNLMTKSQLTYNIPLGNTSLTLANFPNIVVNSLTCIKDTDVPSDANSTPEEIVFVMDSNQFQICTTHKKSEGLIKSEFDPDIVLINGVVGSLQANMAYMLNSPTAIGAVVGCGD